LTRSGWCTPVHHANTDNVSAWRAPVDKALCRFKMSDTVGSPRWIRTSCRNHRVRFNPRILRDLAVRYSLASRIMGRRPGVDGSSCVLPVRMPARSAAGAGSLVPLLGNGGAATKLSVLRAGGPGRSVQAGWANPPTDRNSRPRIDGSRWDGVRSDLPAGGVLLAVLRRLGGPGCHPSVQMWVLSQVTSG
jgi:hypothetical protein